MKLKASMNTLYAHLTLGVTKAIIRLHHIASSYMQVFSVVLPTSISSVSCTHICAHTRTHIHRRMFPPIKVEVFDLDPNTYYVLLMDMAPVDKYRYKYQNSSWVKCFEEECSPTRLYVHPDSPALGSHWMHMIINFYKLKLTNNQLDKQGHVSSTVARKHKV